MPANVVWGLLLLGVIYAASIWLPLVLLAALLALPVAGLHHMAALITRGEATSFSDFFVGMRRHFGPALGLGLGATALALVFTTNIVVGIEAGGIVGASISVLALYGDIGLAMFLVAAWPILVDPVRRGDPVRARLKLAALVNLARPARMFALTAVLTAILIASTVLFAALLTVSVAFVSLVATRYVLPAADRLEGRRTKLPPE